jgi:hypothetical protein
LQLIFHAHDNNPGLGAAIPSQFEGALLFARTHQSLERRRRAEKK